MRNTEKVVEKFMAREEGVASVNKAGKATLWTDGKTIFSYQAPVATWVPGTNREKAAVLQAGEYTPTTSKQCSGVASSLHRSGVEVERVDRATLEDFADWQY